MAAADPTREAGLAERRAASPPGAKRYAVKAVWRTLQGEGAWAGRPAVFVRFAGCNVWTGEERDRARAMAPCGRWCDTDFRRRGSVKLSAADLTGEILAVAGDGPRAIRFVVLTGGEPLLQADAALVRALKAAGFFVACETNGTVALADAFTDRRTDELAAPDWVVCSPKLPEGRLALEWMDELKLVVPDYRPEAYAAFAARVRPHRLGGAEVRYRWLQPEDGPRKAGAARLAVALALADSRWCVSVQTHKLLGVD